MKENGVGRGNGEASMGLSLEETGRHGTAREKLWIFAIYIQQAKKIISVSTTWRHLFLAEHNSLGLLF